MGSSTIEQSVTSGTDSVYSHQVVLFNDSINTFDHVEDCLVAICYKSNKEAKKITREAHEKGRAICFRGSLEECETVVEKLSQKNLTVSLES